MNDELERARIDYQYAVLDEASVLADPFEQFGAWLSEALAHGAIVEPNAMTLATVSADDRPAARIVLLRGYDRRGFVFFSNYESRKGRDLEARPAAALLFYWGILQRQVRIEGTVQRISAEESDAYFARRPRGHQLSAWASRQSTVVADRATLVAAFRGAEERFGNGEVERPAFWGGYRVGAERFEFWQGRPNRVHDRIAYERDSAGWRILRLSP